VYVYHLVDGITGQRLEQVHPVKAPSWARRPEPVSWSADFNILPAPVMSRGAPLETNPDAGLHTRIRPWRHVLTISWQQASGDEYVVAAGIIVTPLETDEAEGTLSVSTKCIREVLDGRFLVRRDSSRIPRTEITVGPSSTLGVVREILQLATTPYSGQSWGQAFELPLDLPPAGWGNHQFTWFGYNFKDALEAIEDFEDEARLVVDFNPYWDSNFRLRWAVEVFSEAERDNVLLDFGSTAAQYPQAEYSGTVEDWSEVATVGHHTGKGSEADILYTRRSTPTDTLMAREVLITRPDIETNLHLGRQAAADYAEMQNVLVQDEIDISLDTNNPDWWAPDQLVIGATVQVTIEDSAYYGNATIQRTLIGWKASGHDGITLELQNLNNHFTEFLGG
jgi:hypothetical protein